MIPIAAFLALAFTLLSGCHRWENAGGRWWVRRTESLPEAGGSQPYLFRMKGISRKPVLEFTYIYRYYGDDCLGFAATPGVFFACGNRAPIRLEVPDPQYLSFGPSGAVQESRNALCPYSVVLVSAAALKRRALQQPEINSYDAYDFANASIDLDLSKAALPTCLSTSAAP